MLADPSKSLTHEERDREERDMQQAIALSMGQPPPGQENGVTGAGHQFGPAQGEYHDTKRWAMTVSKATATEVAENPPPADRQRQQGEPAFLRASHHTRFGGIAALLTIYHSIPLARESLLLPKYDQLNYGYDSQWWMGHGIEAPKIISLDENGARQDRDDMLIEIQRLMAFLDGTNRSYASVDALADMQGYHGKQEESELASFLDAWREGAMVRSRDDPLTQVFSSHGIRNDVNPAENMEKFFSCLEPNVDPEVDQTFTDIMDNIIWADQPPNRNLNDVWLDKLGDIMTFRLSDPRRKQGKLGVEIPTVWYPDRYMDHFREAGHEMRRRKRKISEEISRLNRSRNSLLSCAPTGRQGLDIRKVLSDAAERAPMLIRNQSSYGADTSSSPPLSTAEVNDCVRALQESVKSIDAKVAGLEVERERLIAQLKATAAEITGPNDGAPLSPSHRYTLRGLATKQNITYLLRPTIDKVEDPGTESSVSPRWQWWRISLSSEDRKAHPAVNYGPQPLPASDQGPSLDVSGPYSPWPGSNTQNRAQSPQPNDNVIAYTVRRVGEEDVLKAAREEDDSIILVYASETAVTFQGSSLSAALQMFIKADNKVFENELRGIDQIHSQGSDTAVTNAEEMAQLHFSPPDAIQDVPLFDDSDETMNGDQENLVPPGPTATNAVATPTARRGADGQPSPKRAKGDDDPPPYSDKSDGSTARPEMQERGGGMGMGMGMGMGILGGVRPSRIGHHAEKMMERIEEDAG